MQGTSCCRLQCTQGARLQQFAPVAPVCASVSAHMNPPEKNLKFFLQPLDPTPETGANQRILAQNSCYGKTPTFFAICTITQIQPFRVQFPALRRPVSVPTQVHRTSYRAAQCRPYRRRHAGYSGIVGVVGDLTGRHPSRVLPTSNKSGTGAPIVCRSYPTRHRQRPVRPLRSTAR